jgi:hypothetical protein
MQIQPFVCRGGLQGCEMLTFPHYLDNGLTDGGKVVSSTHLSKFTPQKLFFCFWCSFLLQAEWTPGRREASRIGKLKKCIHPIGFRTRDLPACSIMTQPLGRLNLRLPQIPSNAQHFFFVCHFTTLRGSVLRPSPDVCTWFSRLVESQKLRQQYMVMSPSRLRPEKGWASEAQQQS